MTNIAPASFEYWWEVALRYLLRLFVINDATR